MDTEVAVPQKAEKIVHAWLKQLTKTAVENDLPAHMQLVSRQVKVIGIPKVGYIDYEGWRSRRFNEFNGKLLHSIKYRLHKIINTRDDQIVFRVRETIKATNGNLIISDKDVILQKEKDGCWRVRYERYDHDHIKLR